MYLLGCMLYLLIITLIFYRFTFMALTSVTLTPPYWINMGAVAITTLAGATLILNATRWSFLEEILPFLKGFTLFFWAAATWWIPLLFILGAWRHLYKHFPLVYDPQYWGMVFPLGMYTTCTIQFARATDLLFLLVIPRYFVYIALVAWLVVFAGLIYSLARSLVSPNPQESRLPG
jgi:tellurite resistance protein TehA-like permease